ncbi:MAG: class A beta-lactamase [bacterium]|nr:class A beta-lactamase [bacterium]
MRYCVSILFALLLSSCSGSVSNTLLPINESLQPTGELIFKEDEELQEKLAGFAEEAKGNLGVFALLIEEERAVSLNGNERFAMQSVVKLPVAMTVMQQVSEGKFTLDQKIKFTTEDLVNPNQRSPLRDKNPKGGEITIDELITLAISESDGTACDVLTRIAGGPAAVQSHIETFGLAGMDIKRTHKEFGKDWDMQYENWATPEAAVQLLVSLWSQKDEEPNRPGPILKHMYDTKTGPNRIKGLLPPGTPVAHKTGTGGTRDGITSATNDVGIITLPNGKHIAIAVFVGDSSADERTRELVIAKVAMSAFDTWAK